jgi:adenosylmethionine-8-amino-7-oxononanoate aminotransferase
MAPLAKEIDAYLHLVEEAYSRGLIIYSRRTRGGVEGDHFMVCPPLIVNESQVGEIMEKLTDSLHALAQRFDLPEGNC